MACLRYLVEMYLHVDITLNSNALNDGQTEIYSQKWDEQVKITTNVKFLQTCLNVEGGDVLESI